MENSTTLAAVAISFAAFVLAGFWIEIHGFKREILKWQAKIDTALFGPEGGNGLNGMIRDHEARIRVLESHTPIGD